MLPSACMQLSSSEKLLSEQEQRGFCSVFALADHFMQVSHTHDDCPFNS